MYANLATGECVWDPPEGVPVKRTDSNQWWELFDQKTARFYYYNATSQRTVWHKPTNCDIIPLAKLQTLKHNTDCSPAVTSNQSTQTGHPTERGQALSLSASTPQLRRKPSDLCRSSSFSQRGAEAPLYSNWHDSHLLPLEHFLLNNSRESDSDHSDSGSESLTGMPYEIVIICSCKGHEPDNEDSDQSEGSYLPHRLSHRQVEYLNLPTGVSTEPRERDRECPPTPLLKPLAEPPLQPEREADMEKFAADNLNLGGRGLFRRKASVRDLLSWTQRSLQRPLLASSKPVYKQALEMFRQVQMYMGDRKARPGFSLNSLLMEILGTAHVQSLLRDELFVQLCKQTTENPRRESLLRGWELLTIALAFIPPSPVFQPALLGYLNRHRDPTFSRVFPDVNRWPIHVQVNHYATVACQRLERIGAGGKRTAKRPQTDDIESARKQIFQASLFGNTLREVMQLQSSRWPNRRLPWPQVELSMQVLKLQGLQTEGIFRVSADVDEVNRLKAQMDKWELSEPSDAHVPANLLKLWLRELYEPLIPDSLYPECVAEPMTSRRACDLVLRLPTLHRLVLCYLIRFLQTFNKPDVIQHTKMDASNLAMVFAPNCLRCMASDPRTMFDNARKEMAFLRCLIQDLDTDCVRDMI
ncbi:hypothetical protein D910_01982 [Dendroctonus ponderosae]|uniref:Rho-GAP domain-containing protein n=2 Tax=Dendroctonus ponderosae TaxID=77166 RepID=U4TX27_DENPD|nr:hypothetical protein D910_01982 [Dendroctonus ponderosae]